MHFLNLLTECVSVMTDKTLFWTKIFDEDMKTQPTFAKGIEVVSVIYFVIS